MSTLAIGLVNHHRLASLGSPIDPDATITAIVRLPSLGCHWQSCRLSNQLARDSYVSDRKKCIISRYLVLAPIRTKARNLPASRRLCTLVSS